MNKIKALIILVLLQSCYTEDISDQDIYLIQKMVQERVEYLQKQYAENTCDCVYYNNQAKCWTLIKLKPGQYKVGPIFYSRKSYCEKIIEGYLTNCQY